MDFVVSPPRIKVCLSVPLRRFRIFQLAEHLINEIGRSDPSTKVNYHI